MLGKSLGTELENLDISVGSNTTLDFCPSHSSTVGTASLPNLC